MRKLAHHGDNYLHHHPGSYEHHESELKEIAPIEQMVQWRQQVYCNVNVPNRITGLIIKRIREELKVGIQPTVVGRTEP